MQFSSTVFSPALNRRGVSYGVHPPTVPHLEGGDMGAYLSDDMGLYQPGLSGLIPLPTFLANVPPVARLALIAGASWFAGKRMGRNRWQAWLVGGALAYATDSLPPGLAPTATPPKPAGVSGIPAYQYTAWSQTPKGGRMMRSL
jgi:hypothetical protein